MPSPLAAALPEILAFTPEAFAHLGAHVKPEWFFEALAAGAGGEEWKRSPGNAGQRSA